MIPNLLFGSQVAQRTQVQSSNFSLGVVVPTKRTERKDTAVNNKECTLRVNACRFAKVWWGSSQRHLYATTFTF